MPIDTILLILVVLLLVLVAALLVKAQRQPRIFEMQIGIDPQLEEQVRRINDGVRHNIDVSAILEMFTQIEQFSDEDRARLESYPETVRAAAWLHYINGLGRDLQHAQDELSQINRGPDHNFFLSGGKAETIKAAQLHVDGLRTKLDAAIAASGQTAGARAV